MIFSSGAKSTKSFHSSFLVSQGISSNFVPTQHHQIMSSDATIIIMEVSPWPQSWCNSSKSCDLKPTWMVVTGCHASCVGSSPCMLPPACLVGCTHYRQIIHALPISCPWPPCHPPIWPPKGNDALKNTAHGAVCL